MDKIIGIIGGMGPEATIDLVQKIVDHTPAKKDQDHIHIIVDNNPKIPDRTSAIFNGGEDPTTYLINSANLLTRAGVDFIIIACNTAHYFLPKIKEEMDMPFLDMQEITAEYISQRLKLNKVGILATSGTIKTKLYEQRLKRYNISVAYPDKENQKIVMDVIKQVKAKQKTIEISSLIKKPVRYLVNQEKCEAVIAGCTEIPIILQDGDVEVPVIDPTELIAIKAVEMAIKSPKVATLI